MFGIWEKAKEKLMRFRMKHSKLDLEVFYVTNSKDPYIQIRATCRGCNRLMGTAGYNTGNARTLINTIQTSIHFAEQSSLRMREEDEINATS